MSYRRAWLLVDEMNRCFDPVLVETLKGGGRSAGPRSVRPAIAGSRSLSGVEREAAAVAERPAYVRLREHLRTEPIPTD